MSKKGSIFYDKYDILRDGWVVALWILGVILFVGAIFGLVIFANMVDRHMSAQSCRHWGQQNVRAVRFVSYNYWDWDCLTPNPAQPGTWIPTSRLLVVNK